MSNRVACFDLMNAGIREYDFAVRFNQSKCSGDSPSNLLDRFSVVDGRVLWSDTAAGGTLKPLGDFLKRLGGVEEPNVTLPDPLERSPRW